MIEVVNVTYSYNSTTRIVLPDFTVETGKHFLLLGESGSGKTTLLHALGGLLRKYTGSIRLDETELNTLSETQLDRYRGKNIGFVFQKNHLIKALSVEQNLLLSPYLADLPIKNKDVDAILNRLGLLGKKKSKVTSLSQGQAQRVAIARSVLNKPSVILADEPTSALDDKNCDRVIQLLLEVADEYNASLIVATHDHRLKQSITNHLNLISAS